jgi:hypothetical protein
VNLPPPDQRGDDIKDEKPLFVVVDDAADFLPLKQRDAVFGIGSELAHAVPLCAVIFRLVLI